MRPMNEVCEACSKAIASNKLASINVNAGELSEITKAAKEKVEKLEPKDPLREVHQAYACAETHAPETVLTVQAAKVLALANLVNGGAAKSNTSQPAK